MDSTIYYCVTVDTEEEWQWDQGYFTGPASVKNIQRLPSFQNRCESSGAALAYFTNYAVLNQLESRAVMQSLAQRPRTEIGLHIHPWNTPPLVDAERVPASESFLHHLPWPIQKAKLDTMISIFSASHFQPTCFRGGRYSTSPQIQDFLSQHGLWVDGSVLPGNTWPEPGAPDYRNRDFYPRRILLETEPRRVVWELPLTFGNTCLDQHRGARWLHYAKTKIGRMLHLTAILDRLQLVSQCWLNFENSHGQRMMPFLDVLRLLRPPCVIFTLHSSSLLPNGSPYNRTEQDVQQMLDRISRTLDLIRSWPEFRPATITEIATALEAKYS
ncbi:MAG: hypothetical protein ACRC8S_17680 [Fimbriiglobus sp.]